MSAFNADEAGVDTESLEFRAAVEQAATEKVQAELKARGLERASEEQIQSELAAAKNSRELHDVLLKHGMSAQDY